MTDDELYSSFLAGDTASYDKLMIRHGDGLDKIILVTYSYYHS